MLSVELKSHWTLKWCPGGGTCVGGKRHRKWKSGWDRELETWDSQQVWHARDKRMRSEERVRTMHCKRKRLSLHPLSCVLITFPVPKPSLTISPLTQQTSPSRSLSWFPNLQSPSGQKGREHPAFLSPTPCGGKKAQPQQKTDSWFLGEGAALLDWTVSDWAVMRMSLHKAQQHIVPCWFVNYFLFWTKPQPDS